MTRYGPMFGPDITFLGVERCDLDDPATFAGADVVVVGAPFDGGTSHRPGTRFGPQAIRSTDYLPHDGSRPHLALRVDGLRDLRVLDAGDVEMPPGDIERSLAALHGGGRDGRRPAARSPSSSAATTRSRWPTCTGVARSTATGRVSVVHFDAHADTGDIEFGSLYGHGQPMRRLIESGAARGDRFLQIGLRGYWPGPETLDWMAEQRMRSFEMTEIGRPRPRRLPDRGLRDRDRRLRRRLPVGRHRRRGPGHAPGTGTPEPGGLSARQLLDAVRRVCLELPVVGRRRRRGLARRTTTRTSPRCWRTGSCSRRSPASRPAGRD